jgi:transcriptional regulator with XRE-family HTH domain
MATTLHSPTAGRRRLRNALRHARDVAGFTQEQVAEAMDWSLSKVIRIETGGVGVSTNDLRQLLLLYRIDDPVKVSELVELARIGRQRPWWTQYKELIPSGYLHYVGLEDECSGLRSVATVAPPGLLQTEEYARAVVETGWWVATAGDRGQPQPDEIAERVRIRMIRQQTVLRREPPPEITVVFDEAVLRRQIGGPEVLRQQLLYLIEVAEAAHITIRVVPFNQVPSLVYPFGILEFPDPADPDVVYEEMGLDMVVVDDAEEVGVCRRVFDRMLLASLSEAESVALVARVASELG